jgi:Flp pilus assembly protein TadD
LRLPATGIILAGLFLSTTAGCGGMAAQGLNAEGVRLYDQAQHHEAIQRFENAISSNPNNADAYYNLAAVYHRMGVVNRDPSLVAQAEHYYNQCLDRREDHQPCYRGLAVLLVEQERSEEAFRLIENRRSSWLGCLRSSATGRRPSGIWSKPCRPTPKAPGPWPRWAEFESRWASTPWR